MPRANIKIKAKLKNPFLTEMANTLWRQLDNGKKPISKEDLVNRAVALKQGSGGK